MHSSVEERLTAVEHGLDRETKALHDSIKHSKRDQQKAQTSYEDLLAHESKLWKSLASDLAEEKVERDIQLSAFDRNAREERKDRMKEDERLWEAVRRLAPGLYSGSPSHGASAPSLVRRLSSG